MIFGKLCIQCSSLFLCCFHRRGKSSIHQLFQGVYQWGKLSTCEMVSGCGAACGVSCRKFLICRQERWSTRTLLLSGIWHSWNRVLKCKQVITRGVNQMRCIMSLSWYVCWLMMLTRAKLSIWKWMHWLASKALQAVTARTVGYRSNSVMQQPFHSPDHALCSHLEP